MPPRIKEVVAGLRSMQDASIPRGYQGIAAAAADTIERMHAERLKLDERIHNQRRSCRETWEIVEQRRKWLGSDSARQKYHWLLDRYRALTGRPSAQ
jgi:hypothetical protein